MPKYMLMMNTMRAGAAAANEGFGAMSSDEIKAHIAFMIDLNKGLTERGELVDAQGLAWPDQAKIVSSDKAGNTEISDGPFPESKEFLAGYWIVEVENEQRVIDIATKISTAPGKGGESMQLPVEVREVMSAPPEFL